MIVFPGHSGCFVPVMRFRVAVPTVPRFSVYPRQFAFDMFTVSFLLLFHLPQARIAQKKSDEYMDCPLRFLALRGNESLAFLIGSPRSSSLSVSVCRRAFLSNDLLTMSAPLKKMKIEKQGRKR